VIRILTATMLALALFMLWGTLAFALFVLGVSLPAAKAAPCSGGNCAIAHYFEGG